MENFPSIVSHATGPSTGLGCPSTVTVAEPGPAAAVPVAVSELVVVAELAEVLVEAFVLDASDELSLLEQPTDPASRIVATPTAANSLCSIGTPFPVTAERRSTRTDVGRRYRCALHSVCAARDVASLLGTDDAGAVGRHEH